MAILFHNEALKDYLDFEKTNPKIFQKINQLLISIVATPFSGIGKPESLKYDLSGYWSRRITMEHRLVYKVQDDKIFVLKCKYYY